MTISGPEALAALDEALRDIRGEENEILRKLARGLDRAAKLREGETDLLRQLAESQLPGETAGPLSAELLRTGAAARDVLKRRAGDMAELAARLRELEASTVKGATDRAALLAAVDQHQANLRALAPRIAAAVARLPDYEQQRAATFALRSIAAAARAKSRQADLDRDQKARAYRDEPLFRYLLDRGFGTPTYASRGLVALLDGWLARLIGFPAARQHYDMLEALPALWRGHAEQQARRAAAAEERLDGLEQEATDAAGGSETRTLLTAAQARIAALDAEATAREAERSRLVATETGLAAVDDPASLKAGAALSGLLATPAFSPLAETLRRAATGAAGDIATQLDDIRLRLSEEDADSRVLHARLATLAVRRRDLQEIEARLKARAFDDPRSIFRDASLATSRLDSFLTGATTASAYLNQWLDAQSWSAGTSDWGGGIGLPRHGRELAPAPSPAETKRAPAELSS